MSYLSPKQCAFLCVSTYYDKHSFYKFKVVDDIEAAGYRIKGTNTLAIAIRGTETPISGGYFSKGNWMDLKNDLRFWPVDTEFGKVHRGFYYAAERWLEANKHIIEDHFNDIDQFQFTGHSYGSPLASIAAIMLGKSIVNVTLFGSPKGFYPSSREFYELSGMANITNSIVINRDPICYIPFWGKHVTKDHITYKSPHSLWKYITSAGMCDHDINLYYDRSEHNNS